MFDVARSIETEIGLEKRCVSCREYWPADTEFFVRQQNSRDLLSSRCIACIRAGYWGSPQSFGRGRVGING